MPLLRRRGGDDGPAAGTRYQLHQRLVSIGDDYWIEDESGRRAFKVDGKALVGLRDRFSTDVEGGEDMSATGNLVDHEYEIERGGDTVARVSKRWFRVRDSYGVEIAPGEDEALLLAVTVCIDAMAHPRD
jgi:uncharacterized protein YxjI